MAIQIDSQELRSFVESIELLLKEREELNLQLNDLFNDLKEKQFDAPVIRQLIRMRKLKPKELIEKHDLLTAYINALGMREHCKAIL